MKRILSSIFTGRQYEKGEMLDVERLPLDHV